jgi:hypothetical protein
MLEIIYDREIYISEYQTELVFVIHFKFSSCGADHGCRVKILE